MTNEIKNQLDETNKELQNLNNSQKYPQCEKCNFFHPVDEFLHQAGFTWDIYRKATETIDKDYNKMVDSSSSPISLAIQGRGTTKTTWMVILRSLFELDNFPLFNPLIVKNSISDSLKGILLEFGKMMDLLDQKFGTNFKLVGDEIYDYEKGKTVKEPPITIINKDPSMPKIYFKKGEKAIYFKSFENDRAGLGIGVRYGVVGSIFVDEIIKDVKEVSDNKEKQRLEDLFSKQLRIILSIADGAWRGNLVEEDPDLKIGAIPFVRRLVICSNPYTSHHFAVRLMTALLPLTNEVVLQIIEKGWYGKTCEIPFVEQGTDEYEFWQEFSDLRDQIGNKIDIFYATKKINKHMSLKEKEIYERNLLEVKNSVLENRQISERKLIKIVGLPPTSQQLDEDAPYKYSLNYLKRKNYSKDILHNTWFFVHDFGWSKKNKMVVLLASTTYNPETNRFELSLWDAFYKRWNKNDRNDLENQRKYIDYITMWVVEKTKEYDLLNKNEKYSTFYIYDNAGSNPFAVSEILATSSKMLSQNRLFLHSPLPSNKIGNEKLRYGKDLRYKYITNAMEMGWISIDDNKEFFIPFIKELREQTSKLNSSGEWIRDEEKGEQDFQNCLEYLFWWAMIIGNDGSPIDANNQLALKEIQILAEEKQISFEQAKLEIND